MPLTRPGRLAAVGIALALTASLLVTSLPAAADPPAPAGDPAGGALPGRYVVTMKGDPIATYDGGVKGLKATRAAKGRKLNAGSASAKAYRKYLESQQDQVAARVGVRADGHYAVALNGFSTSLTPSQAKRLERAPGVLSVVKDTPRRMLDDKKPVDFLRLSGKNGVWESLGGIEAAGAGTVVGVLDSGYWPESASFAGAPLGTSPPTADDPFRPYRVGNQIRMNKADGTTFTGVCQPGENAAGDFDGTLCNEKVVGARYFADTYKEVATPANRNDYLSPRDRDGHGTHVGSTAAGKANVPVSINGRSFGKISGVAPAAKLAVYKVCYTTLTDSAGGCYFDAILDAVEAAVTDGVDVINFSISGSDSVVDPVEIAFLNAAAAGVFVSASAGNSGPGGSTLDHPSPWLTTVAASTVAPYAGTVVLGNGKRYAGISTTVSKNVGPARLVRASLVRRTGVSVVRSTICEANTLDRAKARGKIIVCDRGGNTRVDKSDEVLRAGGVGMVLVNLSPSAASGDTQAVPTVHLDLPEATPVRNYSATRGATATLRKGNRTSKLIAYPRVAGFSSRGPSLGIGSDVIKPDIAGPGVDTLAAVSPVTADGRKFDFLSGTSMSAPHIAGVAALYFGKKPTWSPMAVKSALMTTSARTKNADGSLSTDYYAQGAGNVRPSSMFNPGLILDSGPADWLGFIEGVEGVDFPETEAIDPSNYNSPSIAIGKLVGRQTVTRTVTAVRPGAYRATVGVPGVDAKVTPSLLIFSRPGQKKTIKVTFTQRSAKLAQAAFGSLSLRSSRATVRLPIAVTPQVVDAPAAVSGLGASGSVSYSVKPGFSGSFPVTARGLAPGDVQPGRVSAVPGSDSSVAYDSTVPARTRVARWSIASADPRADIDLRVYHVIDDELVLVGMSAGGTGAEQVAIFDPAPGAYVIEVLPYSDPPGADSTDFEYRAFAVGPDLPNLSVRPADPTVKLNKPLTLTASWTGLDATKSYLGFVEYKDGTGTFVEIN